MIPTTYYYLRAHSTSSARGSLPLLYQFWHVMLSLLCLELSECRSIIYVFENLNDLRITQVSIETGSLNPSKLI
jgi:hypothetical protein